MYRHLLLIWALAAGCGSVLLIPDAAPDSGPPITVSVTPTTAVLAVRTSQAFTAQLENATLGVTWSVNGVPGGNAAIGMITADGIYTAPSRRPHPVATTITATSVEDASKSGMAAVTITAQGVLYVTQSNSRVDIFESVGERNGDVAPTRSLVGASTQLSFVIGTAIDVPHDRLYASNYSGQSVTTYTGFDTVTGDMAPAAKLGGTANAAFASLENVDFDPMRNLLYVSGQTPDIKVYDATQLLNGDLAPLRIFKANAAIASADRRTFLDVAHDRFYQTQASAPATIFVFDNASTATGTVDATRAITGATTGLAAPWGIFVDDKRDLLYVGDYSTNKVTVFNSASTVNGDVAPNRVIAPVSGTSMYDIAMDPETDRLAVEFGGAQGVQFFNDVSTLDGTQMASFSVAGTATLVTTAFGLYVDWDR